MALTVRGPSRRRMNRKGTTAKVMTPKGVIDCRVVAGNCTPETSTMHTIFEAYYMDADEGRDAIHVGFFAGANAAREAASLATRDLRNSPAGSGAVREIKVYTTPGEWQSAEREKLVQSARAKLTPQERAALKL